jgi:hypothetical protein
LLKKLAIMAAVIVTALSAQADEPPFQDALLDRFTGQWLLTGTIAGQEVTHDIAADWVLGHQYLRFHDVSRERTDDGALAYEATVIIGWDEPAGRYVCLWLDSTGGSGLASGVLGYAEPADDRLAFVFGDEPATFHTTFAYDRERDVWSWTMDARKDGQYRPFARLTMAKATAERNRTIGLF